MGRTVDSRLCRIIGCIAVVFKERMAGAWSQPPSFWGDSDDEFIEDCKKAEEV